MRLRSYSLLGLLVCGATLFAWPSSSSMNASPPHSMASPQVRNTLAPLNAQQVSPNSKIVDFRQTQFVFTSGSSLNTDWGQVSVDVENIKLRRMIDESGGYLNVVLHDSRLGGPFWVVENLRIPPDSDCRTDGISSDTLREEQIDTSRKTPMSAYFDLRPGIEGSGPVNRLRAAVMVSTSPLPPVLSVWHLLEQASPDEFRVQPQVNNAEGDLGEAPSSTPPSTGDLLLGPPPQPIVPVPELPSNLAFPLEVIQYNQPNINAAKNQCVPMADALVIGYLRIQYNKPPLAWPLPHSSSAGLGLQNTSADVISWEPEPESSRVAQLDARARRSGVLNFDTGGGTDRCRNIRALFSYMAEEGVPSQIVFRHQGGSATYGAGNTCDNGDVLLPLGGITSTRQGVNPTWQWIFDELQKGRGIYMSFGRYDVNGNRTSGHAVRIWGARSFNGKNYIYTLDDGDQGSNNVGLRNTQYEVADDDTPGLPGVPNGRLELDDTSSEIEFVMSMEAKPTLLIL